MNSSFITLRPGAYIVKFCSMKKLDLAHRNGTVDSKARFDSSKG